MSKNEAEMKNHAVLVRILDASIIKTLVSIDYSECINLGTLTLTDAHRFHLIHYW